MFDAEEGADACHVGDRRETKAQRMQRLRGENYSEGAREGERPHEGKERETEADRQTEEGKKKGWVGVGGDVTGGRLPPQPPRSYVTASWSNGSLWAQMWLQLTNQRG